MKLFSPVQAKSSSNTQIQEDVEQVAYLEKTIRALQDTINKETVQFDERMKEQRKLYTEEKTKLQQELLELQKKVKEEERRLTKALKPVDGLRDRAEEVLKKAEEYKHLSQQKEEENNQLYESLTAKLDNLSERETELDQAEKHFQVRKLRLQDEEEQLIKRKDILNTELMNFIERTRKKELELTQRENKVKAQEKMNQEYVDTRTKDLDEQERALKDKREALDRAFSEITRLKQK